MAKPVIYFSASIQGTPTDEGYGQARTKIYIPIIQLLEEYGRVNDDYIWKTVSSQKLEPKDKKEVHDEDIKLIGQSDILVAEVTQASLGVGYEIARAEAMGKRILCLYRPNYEPNKGLSAMIRGAANNDSFIVKDYEAVDKDLPEIVKEFFSK